MAWLLETKCSADKDLKLGRYSTNIVYLYSMQNIPILTHFRLFLDFSALHGYTPEKVKLSHQFVDLHIVFFSFIPSLDKRNKIFKPTPTTFAQ